MTKAEIAVLVLRIFGALPAALSVSELISYAMDPAGYPFGTEIAGFQYNSPVHFVISHCIVVLLYVSAYVLRGAPLRIVALIAQIGLFAAMYH